MRDRLMELLINGKEAGGWIAGMALWADVIADHLIANGVIVPPCKVGDTVFLLYPIRRVVCEAVVEELNLTQTSNFIVARASFFNRRQEVFFEQFGKTVFLTREEAEAALKERL